MPSILNPKFRYVPASHTNLHKTFARIRRQMKKEEEKKPAEPMAANVTRLQREAK